jgi:hypothetical protein
VVAVSGSLKAFGDDSIPGTRLVRELAGRPEKEAAAAVRRRLSELTSADALERTVLMDYVRDHVRAPELAREIAVQEMRGDNASSLPADPAWQVSYLTSTLNTYLDAGKNDDYTLTSAIDAIASQANPDARLAMAQALLSRAHDGSVSVQDALAARGVSLPEGERNPSSASPARARPAGAIEESF